MLPQSERAMGGFIVRNANKGSGGKEWESAMKPGSWGKAGEQGRPFVSPGVRGRPTTTLPAPYARHRRASLLCKLGRATQAAVRDLFPSSGRATARQSAKSQSV
jgi:hypothetical protein